MGNRMVPENHLKTLSNSIARKIFSHLLRDGCEGCDYSSLGCSMEKLMDIFEQEPLDEKASEVMFCARLRDIIHEELHSNAVG